MRGESGAGTIAGRAACRPSALQARSQLGPQTRCLAAAAYQQGLGKHTKLHTFGKDSGKEGNGSAPGGTKPLPTSVTLPDQGSTVTGRAWPREEELKMACVRGPGARISGTHQLRVCAQAPAAGWGAPSRQPLAQPGFQPARVGVGEGRAALT